VAYLYAHRNPSALKSKRRVDLQSCSGVNSVTEFTLKRTIRSLHFREASNSVTEFETDRNKTSVQTLVVDSFSKKPMSSNNGNRYSLLGDDSPASGQAGPRTGLAGSRHAAAPASVSAPAPAPAEQPRRRLHIFDMDMSDVEDEVEEGAGSKAPAEGQDEHMAEQEPGSVYEFVDELPPVAQFREFELDIAKPEANPYIPAIGGIDLGVLHRDYRGSDVLKSKDFASHNPRPCQIVFFDKGEDHRLRQGVPGTAGYLSMEHGKTNRDIKIILRQDSQMPFFTVRLLRPGRKWEQDDGDSVVKYHVFSNSVATPHEKDVTSTLSVLTYTDEVDKDITARNDTFFQRFGPKRHANLEELAKAKNLMAIKVNLVAPNEPGRLAHKGRPVWTGLNASELEDIKIKRSKDRASLTPFEETLYKLDTGVSIGFFRRIDSSNLAEISSFRDVFLGSMYLCLRYGNFWFYRLQAQAVAEDGDVTDIFSPGCVLAGLEPPRWMCRKWQIAANPEDGAITHVRPINWAPFSDFPIFATVDDYAFEIRLGITRERQGQMETLKRMMTSSKGKHVARFEALQQPGTYLGRIKVPDVKMGSTWENLKPELDTRITLEVEMTGGTQLEYRGAVCEDPLGEDGGDNDTSDYCVALDGPVFPFSKGALEVTVTLWDDMTSTNRALKATQNMACLPIKRQEGADLKALLFRAGATIPVDKQGSLASALDEKTIAESAAFLKGHHNLNKLQLQAAKDAITSRSGVTILYGPPGTGKSTADAAIALQHQRLGRKVLFTCPANKAVDAALATYNKKAPKKQKLRVIRFTGGPVASEPPKKAAKAGPDDAAKASWQALFAASVNVGSSAHPEQNYWTVKRKAIGKWSANWDHPMHETAVEYVALETQSKTQSTKNQKKVARDMKQLEEPLADHFLKHEVDIVFATCSSAMHETLVGRFKPDVAIIDEAGQATIADACMAVEPYKETITSIVLSGDPNQLAPVVTAPLSNEAAKAMSKSIFARLVEDPNRRFPHIMLQEQYRSHYDVIAWVSAQFYGNSLRNNRKANEIGPKAQAIRSFFAKKLGRAKNDRCRMAIDVPGPDAYSERYENTTSYCNRAEADVIVGLVKQLLQLDTLVDAGDIGIITPYKGQRHLIQKLLMADGADTAWAKAVTNVSTTWGVQGNEVGIAFISLCTNEKNRASAKLNLVSRPNALCVQNSRAMWFQVTTGNFSGWCNKINEGLKTDKLCTRSSYKALKSLITHHYRMGDIVSLADVEKGILSANVSPPTTSYFYTTAVPFCNGMTGSINGGETAGKRKAENTRPDTNRGPKASKANKGASAPKASGQKSKIPDVQSGFQRLTVDAQPTPGPVVAAPRQGKKADPNSATSKKKQRKAEAKAAAAAKASQTDGMADMRNLQQHALNLAIEKATEPTDTPMGSTDDAAALKEVGVAPAVDDPARTVDEEIAATVDKIMAEVDREVNADLYEDSPSAANNASQTAIQSESNLRQDAEVQLPRVTVPLPPPEQKEDDRPPPSDIKYMAPHHFTGK
jgi:hypothetical protein